MIIVLYSDQTYAVSGKKTNFLTRVSRIFQTASVV